MVLPEQRVLTLEFSRFLSDFAENPTETLLDLVVLAGFRHFLAEPMVHDFEVGFQ